MRTAVLALLTASLGLAQTRATQGVFIAQAGELARRVTNADDARAAIQRNLGISPEAAAAIFNIGQEYAQGAENIEQKLLQSLPRQRAEPCPQPGICVSPAETLIEASMADLDTLAASKLDALKNRLRVEDYVAALAFMRAHPEMSFFPYRATGSATLARLLQTPVQFWLQSIKGPLSGPDADTLFRQTYVDALLPPTGQLLPYLTGSVVGVEPGRVLLSIENTGQADAAILLDGREWILKSQPAVGSTVRFSGAIRGWTKSPFRVDFAPERVGGLDLVTR